MSLSDPAPFDFTAKLKDGEEILWTGRGSGQNMASKLIFPMVAVAGLGGFLLLGFPLSGFQTDMAWVALFGLAISGLVIWFFRARMLAPPSEDYAITTHRVLIVSGPIGRICRSYLPSQNKRTDRRAMMFYAIKHIAKRRTIMFVPTRARSMPQGFDPVFVGIENALAVAELAAETFQLKLIKR
ncbi:MAG: hypothetical protein AAFY82_01295 [Pseudomonadota bacterium]